METRTAGSESGLGKRTDGNTGTAPQADSTKADICSRTCLTKPRGLFTTSLPRILMPSEFSINNIN